MSTEESGRVFSEGVFDDFFDSFSSAEMMRDSNGVEFQRVVGGRDGLKR